MVTRNSAAEALRKVRVFLLREGWEETRVAHFRHSEYPSTAVEAGYAYGEVTVRFKKIEDGIDRGEISVERGVSDEWIDSIIYKIARLARD